MKAVSNEKMHLASGVDCKLFVKTILPIETMSHNVRLQEQPSKANVIHPIVEGVCLAWVYH